MCKVRLKEFSEERKENKFERSEYDLSGTESIPLTLVSFDETCYITGRGGCRIKKHEAGEVGPTYSLVLDLTIPGFPRCNPG